MSNFLRASALLLATSLLFAGCQSTPRPAPHFVLDDYGQILSTPGHEKTAVPDDNVAGQKLEYQTIYDYAKPESNRIRCEIGSDFGLSFSVTNFESLRERMVQVVFDHPAMTNPQSGKISYRDVMNQRLTPRDNQIGWVLNHDYELAKGPWKISVYYQKEKVLEQEFILE